MNRQALLLLTLLTGLPGLVRAATPQRKLVHIYVALCDNANQGIAPVPAALGNGQDPKTNLYWGAQYGLRTYLQKHREWRLIAGGLRSSVTKTILERAVFYHDRTATWLVADAYDGKHIKTAIQHFLAPPPGDQIRNIAAGGVSLRVGKTAHLRCYVGHNGLMEFTVPVKAATAKRRIPAMVFACKSKSYFAQLLSKRGLHPLLTTTQFMAPEAYAVEAAVTAWAAGQDPGVVHKAAARAYAKYQRCSERAAGRLFAYAPFPAKLKAGSVAAIRPPAGFEITPAAAGTFPALVRTLPLKAPGTPVRTWKKEIARPADAVFAVIDWPLPDKVQQCADVAIRLYSQYLRSKGRPIVWTSLSGQAIGYDKWRTGYYRLGQGGTKIVYGAARTTAKADNVHTFENYLRFVMTYCNSASLARDLPVVAENKVRAGDLYIQPSPSGGIGHASVVLGVCRNRAGQRRYLMGYGFIPAQDFHIARAPGGAWFSKAEWLEHVAHFGKGQFYRFQ